MTVETDWMDGRRWINKHTSSLRTMFYRDRGILGDIYTEYLAGWLRRGGGGKDLFIKGFWLCMCI